MIASEWEKAKAKRMKWPSGWFRPQVRSEPPGWWGEGGQWSGAILGIGSHTVFLHQSTAPSPGGIGRSATGLLAGDAWAAEPGISLQTLTVSFLCSSLPVPTPHLCKSLGIQLSPALERAKALGEEIDRGLPPPKLLCWDPQWLIVPSSGEEAVGGVLVNKSVPGAS